MDAAPEDHETAAMVDELFQAFLGRAPTEIERLRWQRATGPGHDFRTLFREFQSHGEVRARKRVRPFFPAGHYHSPIVDPAEVSEYHAAALALGPEDIRGISIDLERMTSFWDGSVAFMRGTPFTETRTEQNRFYFEGAPYPWGDAMTLRAMIAAYRPAHVIEIGSGFSTACMLDSADHCGLEHLQITCIDPYADRLRGLLRPEDAGRVSILETPVQAVSADMVEALGPNDFLFIDSTHVLKTGSDVHFELFEILPRVPDGVLVHIHDCPFPFEYPEKWAIERNYSWNEAYALRAFLMYNTRFSILFWNSLFARRFRSKVARDCPDFLRNPGSSIWLSVQG